MRIIIALLLVPFLTGCDNVHDKIIEMLHDRDSNLVILVGHQVKLTPKPLTIKPEKAITGNKSNTICFVLASNVPIESANATTSRVNKLTNGIDFSGSIKIQGGQIIEFKQSSQQWSKFGAILQKDELSSCLHKDCECDIEGGKKIEEITVLATGNLSIKGIFWESIDDTE